MAKRLTFLDKAPDLVLRDIIAHWQGNSGRALYPSQIENLEMHALAYRESLLRNDIQRAAMMNLVGYAIGPHQDALGAMLNCPRLQPSAAECKVKFALAVPSPSGRAFPAGTRAATEDGKHVFETLAPAYVISNKTESSLAPARCVVPGRGGNGLEPGILCCLDPEEEGVSVENATASEGGADLEADLAYRERLLLAPAQLSCGGTFNGYRYWARKASALVSDAYPTKGIGGDIHIYVLSVDGAPSQELLAKVAEVCNSDDVRLINDYVMALPAIRQDYSIRAEITVFDSHDPEMALDQVTVLAHEYARKQRLKLGQDVTPTQLLMALSPVGECLYHVNLVEPRGIIAVGPRSFAEASGVEISLAGVTGG